LACTNVASWIPSSVLTILGRSACSSSSKLSALCKTFVPLKQRAKAQGFVLCICLLDHLKRFTKGSA
jgi:hypothetical protein